MPKKFKSHSGTKDRVRISKTGKLMHRRSYGSHFLQKKSGARKRNIASTASFTGKNSRNIKRQLGV